ncbi:MAG: hypothetical protein U5L11_03630 [Arhodomonas sp.]|nr:hypothetical protein [Arhodomonas sp.]
MGGAGTIGQAVVREIFRRNPAALDVVDISENNLVELVRDLRSSIGYIDGDFRTFALDAGSVPFDALMREAGGYGDVVHALRNHERTGRPLGSEPFVEKLEAVLGRTLKTCHPSPDVMRHLAA